MLHSSCLRNSILRVTCRLTHAEKNAEEGRNLILILQVLFLATTSVSLLLFVIDRTQDYAEGRSSMPQPEPEPIVPTNAYQHYQQAAFAGGSQPSNSAPRRQVHTPYPSRMPGLSDPDVAARPQSRPMPQQVPNAPPFGASGSEPDLARVLQPITPANPSVYGPTDLGRIPGPQSPLTNPLPPPPRDLYELSPYNALLNLPQTTALLTASYSNQIAVGDGVKRSKTGLFGGKQSGGIFRSLSFSKKQPPRNKPDVKFVPVFVDRQTGSASIQGSSSSSATPSGLPMGGGGGGVGGGQPQGQPQGPPGPSFQDQSRSMQSPRMWYANQPQPPPPQPGPSQTRIVPPIIFSQSTPEFFGFLNHAPFRVMYQNKTYPTATHLYEALKYIPDNAAPPGWNPRPDLAQQICMTRNVADVYSLSASFRQFERPDWGLVFLRVVCRFCAFSPQELIRFRWKMSCILNSDNIQIYVAY